MSTTTPTDISHKSAALSLINACTHALPFMPPVTLRGMGDAINRACDQIGVPSLKFSAAEIDALVAAAKKRSRKKHAPPTWHDRKLRDYEADVFTAEERWTL